MSDQRVPRPRRVRGPRSRQFRGRHVRLKGSGSGRAPSPREAAAAAPQPAAAAIRPQGTQQQPRSVAEDSSPRLEPHASSPRLHFTRSVQKQSSSQCAPSPIEAAAAVPSLRRWSRPAGEAAAGHALCGQDPRRLHQQETAEIVPFLEFPTLGCVEIRKSRQRPQQFFAWDCRAQRELSDARLGPPIGPALGGLEHARSGRRREYPNFGIQAATAASTLGNVNPANLCMELQRSKRAFHRLSRTSDRRCPS